MRRDLAYLEDIIAAADAIAKFIGSRDLEYLLSSELLQSALAHQFTVIGEAVSRVASDLRERHPLVPWAKAKGMRNIVVHQYFGIAWEEVWQTATVDIRLLREQVAAIIKTEFVMPKIRNAICLLSGGLDSATCLALARREGYACYALSFDYGQRHKIELEAAARVAAALGAERHLVMKIGLDAFGGSALTDDIDVPKGRSAAEMSHGIPVTYVPARNTIFLSFALAWAEVLESSDIFIGVNALDYSGYPDCRPEYIEAYERMANLATKAGVEGRARLKIHTPLLRLSKAQIVKLGRELNLPFALTYSCYDPVDSGRPCGQCDACLLRNKGFQEAGIEDR
jgi:7-cyano-7-deazaguanine synthase